MISGEYQSELSLKCFSRTVDQLEIAWKIDVWCFQLIEIVETNLGDCLFIGIALRNVFIGCLLIRIAWTIDFGWCAVHELKLLGQMLSETVH